jgi:hypothetical protein
VGEPAAVWHVPDLNLLSRFALLLLANDVAALPRVSQSFFLAHPMLVAQVSVITSADTVE